MSKQITHKIKAHRNADDKCYKSKSGCVFTSNVKNYRKRIAREKIMSERIDYTATELKLSRLSSKKGTSLKRVEMLKVLG